MERFFLQLSYIVLSGVIGFLITVAFYVAGDPFVGPALYLSGLIIDDRGGESLMPAF